MMVQLLYPPASILDRTNHTISINYQNSTALPYSVSNDKIRTIAVLHVIYCTPCIASTRTLRCTEFLDYICQIRRVLWRIGWHYAKQKHHSITFSSVLYYFISFCYKMIQFLHFRPNFISRTFFSRNFLSFFPPQVHVIPYLHLHCSPQQYYSLF